MIPISTLIIEGPPGAGKTSLLAALASRGVLAVNELPFPQIPRRNEWAWTLSDMAKGLLARGGLERVAVDRGYLSTAAYRSIMRPGSATDAYVKWMRRIFPPHHTIYLDIDPTIGLFRKDRREVKGDPFADPDLIHRQGVLVRRWLTRLPERHLVLDAGRSADELTRDAMAFLHAPDCSLDQT